MLELQSKIQSQVKENIDKSQRRYYLQEQMKAIRKELGEGDADRRTARSNQLRAKLEAAKLPENRDEGGRPRARRARSDPQRQSPEYGVIRT